MTIAAEPPVARRGLGGDPLWTVLLLAALVVYAGTRASPYDLRVLTLAGCQALLVLGYQFIFGHAGALSLAQGAFFGLGTYVTAILGTRYHWGFAATFPLSILAPLALAAVVAVPVLRLASHYFALATLGLAQVALLLVVNAGDWTGGALGLTGVPGSPSWVKRYRAACRSRRLCGALSGSAPGCRGASPTASRAGPTPCCAAIRSRRRRPAWREPGSASPRSC